MEKADRRIKQGAFEPSYAGCEHAPYRIRFVPKERPRIFTREFVGGLMRLANDHSLIVQTRYTWHNFFLDTGKPSGLYGRIRKSLGLTHRKKLLRVF
jgi:hypothetical protein